MPAKRTEAEWTARLILVAVGAYILILGPTDPSNLVLGIPLTFGPLLESREIRVLFRITINRLSGKEVFQIQEARESTIFQGGTHYHGVRGKPRSKKELPNNLPSKGEPEWLIDDAFDLGAEEYQEFPIELQRGERLSGSVEADETVSVFLLGPGSLRSFKEDSDFNYYWGREDVSRTNISFQASDSKRFYLVITNDDDEETVSVEVKLRVEHSTD